MDNSFSAPIGVPPPQTFTSTLLACLEQILLVDKGEKEQIRNADNHPEKSELSKTWRPGKATEVMSRFKNGTLLTCAVGNGKDALLKPPPLLPSTSAASTVAKTIYQQPEKNCTTVVNNMSTESIDPFRRPFRPPSRKPPSEMMPPPNRDLDLNHHEQEANPTKSSFKSAYEVLQIEDKARGIKRPLPPAGMSSAHPANRGPIPKIAKMEKDGNGEGLSDNPEVNALMEDERLKNVEPKMVEAILNEVIEVGASTDWNDIAGLEGVKSIIREIIIWPMQRPDLFTGLRGPPKGILLFGPPGTGKTMFGRLIATKSESTFFNISASSLMSKWCGDGEKMVRALFQVARVKQPAVIFIDEIDSILTQRSDSEHEASRRLKTEFLIQFDGCGTKSDDKLLVIGVTNRPQELDEAARRRLVKRIYIPLPEAQGRQQLIRNLLSDQSIYFTDEDYVNVASLTDGYSGADMASLCREAAYGPIRDIGHDIQNIQADKVRPIQFNDFEHALKHVKPSVASTDLTQYEMWDKQFGCHV